MEVTAAPGNDASRTRRSAFASSREYAASTGAISKWPRWSCRAIGLIEKSGTSSKTLPPSVFPVSQLHAEIGQMWLISIRRVEQSLVQPFKTITIQARADLTALFESTQGRLCGELQVPLAQVGLGLQTRDE